MTSLIEKLEDNIDNEDSGDSNFTQLAAQLEAQVRKESFGDISARLDMFFARFAAHSGSGSTRTTIDAKEVSRSRIVSSLS